MEMISLACLLGPKLLFVSICLLNSVWIHPLLLVINLYIIGIIHKHMLRNNITIFDKMQLLVSPAYYQFQKESNDEESSTMWQKIRKQSIAVGLHLITFSLYYGIGWILRSTVFHFTIKINENEESQVPGFLKNVALQSMFTLHWGIIISIYIAFAILHYVFSGLYYRLGHPWSIEYCCKYHCTKNI